jgi:alpha-beta hydrolase superfamily lysophospholipase
MMRSEGPPRDGGRPIGGPPPQREALLHTPDDEWLHLEHFAPPTPPRLVVVFTHGFSSYGAPYRHVAHALVEVGCAVTLYDARGHGHSTGRRGYVRDFSDYTDDLARVVARAREPFPGVPFALIGHSQGGAVTLDYVLSEAAEDRPRPVCAVAATPMLQITVPIPWFKRVVDAAFGPLFPRVAIPNGITARMVSRNEDIRTAFARDPLVHHVATSAWFRTAEKAEKRLLVSAPTLSVPTLLLTAGHDLIVSPQAQDDFARAAPPHLLEQRRYPALYHEVFLEPERDEVIAEVVSWALAKAGAPAVTAT